MVRLDPFRGAVAQGTTAVVQVLGYFLLQVPFSSSHLATASALGAGVNQRFNALKSRIVLQILLVWLVTHSGVLCARCAGNGGATVHQLVFRGGACLCMPTVAG